MKRFIIRNLHSILGFENYLYIFTLFKIATLSFDKRKREYVYFSKMFGRGSNIIVIGANTGITTVPVAKNVPEGKVFAIEPIRENYRTLERVIVRFGLKNVESMNFALGRESGTAEMVLPVLENTKSHGLCYVREESIAGYQEGITYKVPMKTLDEIFTKDKLKIDGIKIVAENYEKFIFLGGEEFIRKNMPVIYCELWFNENRRKTLELITSWGYSINVLSGHELVPLDENIHHTKNLFFLPPHLQK